MGIGIDGSTICDKCYGQFFPGCKYEDGSEDLVIELWPSWEHDSGYHVCIDCLRREHSPQYLAEIRAMDKLLRERWAT